MINKVVLKNIYNDLLELANKELQISYWLRGNDGRISSYSELMCRLYDDDALGQFLEKDVFDLKLSSHFIGEFLSLKNLLDRYEEKNRSAVEIINDSDWIEVTKQAEKVIEFWHKELPLIR